jgi:hypothetical protein
MGTCANCIDVTKLGTGKCNPLSSDCVVYSGPNLPCSTIKTNETITLALQKIEAILCTAGSGINLSYLASPIDGTVENSGGTDAIIPLANSVNAGLLSPAGFITIQGIGNLITQFITDGDTTHAPSGDAVFDALFLKADNSNVLHTTGSESFTGYKSSINTVGLPSGITLVNDIGTSTNVFSVQNDSEVEGAFIWANAGGPALQLATYAQFGGPALKILASTLSTGKGLVFLKSGIETTWIDNNGEITAPKFIVPGGLSTQFLKADGSLDSTVYQPLITSPITGTGAVGQVAFWTGANTQSGDNSFVWDNTNKRAGFGTSTPGVVIDVVGTSFASSQIRTATVSNTDISVLAFRRARIGTTAVLSGDAIGSVGFRGHDGTSYGSASTASIDAYASENFTTGAKGSSLAFLVTPKLSSTPINPLNIFGTSVNVQYDFANPTNVQGAFYSTVLGKGDNATFKGVIAGVFQAKDRPDVTALNKGVLYAINASVAPLIDRNNVPFDDVGCFIANNDGTGIGTDAIYISKNSTSFNTTSQWSTLFTSDANAKFGIRLMGIHTVEYLRFGTKYVIDKDAVTTTSGNINPATNNSVALGTDANNYSFVRTNSITSNTTLSFDTVNNNSISILQGGIQKIRLFNTSNLVIQNGGTFVDKGQRLQVEGTTLLNGITTLGVLPTTSAGTYDILTRNTSTGVIEKIASSSVVIGTGTINTIPKFGTVSGLVDSTISDTGIGVGGMVTINNFIGGQFTRTIPTGDTFIGQGVDIIQSTPTSRLRNIETITYIEDGIASTVQIGGWLKQIANSKSTNQPTVSFISNESRFSQNGLGTLSAISIHRSSLNGSGTGGITSAILYEGFVNPMLNTFPITNFFGFLLTNSPQNNVTNSYGVRIGELYGSAISRAVDLGVSSGTGKYNIYSGGTADNYLLGNTGIGTLPFSNEKLRVGGNITGSTTSYGTSHRAVIQSDVTTQACYNISIASTQAASFTLGFLQHYAAIQGTFGAGSTVTTQIGFGVDSSLIGAVNNRAFRGGLNSAPNNYNLFMDGTASNYINGDVSIGTLTTGNAKLNIGGTSVASSGVARSIYLNTPLTASANNDTLVGIEINPSFTNGSFTNVTNLALKAQGEISVIRPGVPTQSVNITGNNSATATPYINSYSSANNAKQLIIASSTDVNNTAPTGGFLGIWFNILGANVSQITQNGNLIVGTVLNLV